MALLSAYLDGCRDYREPEPEKLKRVSIHGGSQGESITH
jgi:hypothetical protein